MNLRTNEFPTALDLETNDRERTLVTELSSSPCVDVLYTALHQTSFAADRIEERGNQRRSGFASYFIAKILVFGARGYLPRITATELTLISLKGRAGPQNKMKYDRLPVEHGEEGAGLRVKKFRPSHRWKGPSLQRQSG